MIFNILNISIIAHINHGKTTLLNSIINFSKNFFYYKKNFFLKNNYNYTIKNNIFTLLNYNKVYNFIDCPGHFDFFNDIYKCIFISNFCIILIDILNFVKPQTLFFYNLSKKFNKKIIIFINKIDLFFYFFKLKKKIFNYFGKKNKIYYLSCKFNIGIKKIFFLNYNIFFFLKKIIFIIDFLNHLKFGNILIVKVINGIIFINDILYNKNNSIKILKIGIFLPKNFFLKKTLNFSIHYFVIQNELEKKNSFFFEKKINKKIKFFFPNIFYQVYISNKNYLLKIIYNDYFIKYKKINSNLFGLSFLIGFLGNLHSKIFFKKLSIFEKFNFSNLIILYLINKKKNWYINDIEFEKIFFDQIMLMKLFILKKNFFKVIKEIFFIKINIIKIKNYKKLILIFFYINLYFIINFFFKSKINNINEFIFYEFIFHHFENSNLNLIYILINNKIIKELKFFCLNEIKKNCLNYFNKIKIFLKNKMYNLKISFLLKNKILFTKIIFGIKKNVIEKCYGGDITRKKKLIENQNKKKKILNYFNNFFIDKKILIKIINEKINF